MKGRIKFHSIYYRYPLFIILLVIAGAKFISNGKDISMTYFGDVLTIGQDQLTYITTGLTLAIVVIFSIVVFPIYNQGFSVVKVGITCPRPKLINPNMAKPFYFTPVYHKVYFP